jgi:hypothetical protein
MQCAARLFTMDKKEIAYLKFILEGYSGLAVLSTIDAKEGCVILHIAPGAECEMAEIMRALTQEIKSLKHIRGSSEQPSTDLQIDSLR